MHPLFQKFINKTLTDDEWDEFLSWIEIPENRAQAQVYFKTDYRLNYSYQDHKDINRDFEELRKKLQSEEKRKKPQPFTFLRIAAAIVIFLGLTIGSWYFHNTFETASSGIQQSIVQGTDKAVLTLEDGTLISLGKNESYQGSNAFSQGGKITYQKAVKGPSLIYNYLTVPLGGQFSLELSDGTKVWLNSGTRIKYPVAFGDSGPRMVELLFGEAYFDVSPAAEHGDHVFQIRQNDQTVTVIGTQFSIKAYPDENHIYTTVKEGKVAITANEEKVVLLPDHQSVVNRHTRSMRVIPVNAADETAWIKGLFVFKSKSLQEITQVLSRWYNIPIHIKNENLNSILFRGTLSKNLPLEKILQSIKSTKFINDFTIGNDRVIIE